MHGLGNDYVYIDVTKENIPDDISEFAKIISDRHFGVGSDGLILICPSDRCDFKMKMYNMDGSEAQMCGNGIRCVGKYVYDKGLTKKNTITIETLAGDKTLNLNIENGKVSTVKVDMGEPILEPRKIPVVIQTNDKVVKDLSIKVLDKTFNFTCVSMGNPHAVTVVNDIEKFDVEKYGSILEKDIHFPERANIEFIEIIDPKTIKMRVWERGAGETFACGTGACAATVASIINKLGEREVTVKLLGGDLKIKWDKENNHVYMTGPAITVFEGEINL